MKKNHKFVLDTIQLLLGNAMSAFGMACFALPYHMTVAGVTGIGRMLHYYFGFNVTISVAVINVSLFVVGFLMLGKKFAATIAVGTFFFPFCLGVFQKFTVLHHLVNDPLLAAICAGVLDGVGLGLVLRMGGSTGGMDVPPIILNRKLGWKVAPILYVCDVVIFLLQIPVTSTNGIILGILYALIYSVVMNRIIVMDQGGVQIMIFSRKSAEMNERLLQLGYGTTLMHTTSGYMQKEQRVVYSVVSSRNLNAIKRAALAVDDKAFITISSVSEINGNGFTTDFLDQDYVPEVEERKGGLEIMRQKQAAKKAKAEKQNAGTPKSTDTER